MKVTIDNLDGLGAVDYSAAVVRGAEQVGVRITRTLNAPSRAEGTLCLYGTQLATPVRRGRVTVTSDAGTVLFTGYMATTPASTYMGAASEGSVYNVPWAAVSDEWLLDKQSSGDGWALALGGTGTAAMAALMARVDAGRLGMAGSTGAAQLGVVTGGVVAGEATARWSAQAAAVVAASGATYRAVSGTVTLTPVGSVVHTVSDGDGTVQMTALEVRRARELANDVTLTGEMEPTTYWTELFEGDGTTAEFDLMGEPESPNLGRGTLVEDGFSSSALNTQTWSVSDPGSHLSIGASGLTMTGGNGLDGQTTLGLRNPVELGGTVVVTLEGVMLSGASAGVVGGLYAGAVQQANCFAGWSVGQSGGNTVVTPMVGGAMVGEGLTLASGSSYTLRMRVHCAEMLRVQQTYTAFAGGSVGLQQFGGGLASASCSMVFEARNEGAASNTPVTVLYDGAVASAPAQAQLVTVNSVQLFGSVQRVMAVRTGSAWVTGRSSAGTVATLLTGSSTDGVDCEVEGSVTGKVTFYTGRVPAAGQMVTVGYRGRARSTARVANAASLAAEAAGGGVGTARWVGHVTQPAARCSEDCANAAQALLSVATSTEAALNGQYAMVSVGLPVENETPDVWPGDALALTANGSSANVVVRTVTIDDGGSAPETLRYRMRFANDWAEALAMTLSETVPADAVLPTAPVTLQPDQTVDNPARVLANLAQLAVAGMSGSGSSAALTVDAGVAPPAGGGFEVRRHDGGFGQGGGDLVLRSPVRGFSIPRSAVEERFFVRMYDGSTPPLYSRWSSAIATNLPLG